MTLVIDAIESRHHHLGDRKDIPQGHEDAVYGLLDLPADVSDCTRIIAISPDVRRYDATGKQILHKSLAMLMVYDPNYRSWGLPRVDRDNCTGMVFPITTFGNVITEDTTWAADGAGVFTSIAPKPAAYKGAPNEWRPELHNYLVGHLSRLQKGTLALWATGTEILNRRVSWEKNGRINVARMTVDLDTIRCLGEAAHNLRGSRWLNGSAEECAKTAELVAQYDKMVLKGGLGSDGKLLQSYRPDTLRKILGNVIIR